MWRRRTNEYMRALRERHRSKHAKNDHNLAVGDVVIIKSSERNRNQWPLGIVEKLIKGTDGIVRAVRLRSGRDRLERAVQRLYPLELSCDTVKQTKGENAQEHNPVTLDAAAAPFVPRRRAASEAKQRISEIIIIIIIVDLIDIPNRVFQ